MQVVARASSGTEAMIRPERTLVGLALCMAGVLLIAGMDTTTKYLAERYPAPMVVALRYISQCLLMVLVLAPKHGRQLLQARRRGLVLARASCLAVASLCVTLALQRMPVAETLAIVFLYPMLVVIMAGPVLQERVGGQGWLAVIAGFFGVLLIARPGAGLDAMGVVLALCAAIANAIYQLLSRVLADGENMTALLFHVALVGAVSYGLALPWYWSGAIPPAAHVGMFFCTGVFGAVGHYLVTAANRHCPASVLAPLQYTQLIWASLLGWAVFGTLPQGAGVSGMIIVAVSGSMLVLRSRASRDTRG